MTPNVDQSLFAGPPNLEFGLNSDRQMETEGKQGPASMQEGRPPDSYDRRALLGRKILIIVENLPVPFDRRVWQEAVALVGAGAEVSVICPKGKSVKNRVLVLLEG